MHPLTSGGVRERPHAVSWLSSCPIRGRGRCDGRGDGPIERKNAPKWAGAYDSWVWPVVAPAGGDGGRLFFGFFSKLGRRENREENGTNDGLNLTRSDSVGLLKPEARLG